MSDVDRSADAVARRVAAALGLGVEGRAAGAAKGIRSDPAAVTSRLRRVGELRRLALALAVDGRDGEVGRATAADPARQGHETERRRGARSGPLRGTPS